MDAKQMKGMGLAEGGKAKKSVMVGVLARLKSPSSEKKVAEGEYEKGKEMREEGGAEEHKAHEAAASEMIDAVHNKDAKSFVSSLKNFLEAVRMGSNAEVESQEHFEKGEGKAGGGYAMGGPLSKNC